MNNKQKMRYSEGKVLEVYTNLYWNFGHEDESLDGIPTQSVELTYHVQSGRLCVYSGKEILVIVPLVFDVQTISEILWNSLVGFKRPTHRLLEQQFPEFSFFEYLGEYHIYHKRSLQYFGFFMVGYSYESLARMIKENLQ